MAVLLPSWRYGAGFPSGSAVKNLPAMQETQETWVWSLGQEDPLEKGIAILSSILAWRIPWTNLVGCSSWGREELDQLRTAPRLVQLPPWSLRSMSRNGSIVKNSSCGKGLDGVHMGCPGSWGCTGGQWGWGGSEKVFWRRWSMSQVLNNWEKLKWRKERNSMSFNDKEKRYKSHSFFEENKGAFALKF